LPNSLKAGQGLTRIPFKCRINKFYTNNEHSAIQKKKKENHEDKFRDLVEINAHLTDLNQKDLEEIQVDFPISERNDYLVNFDFIDCIGLPDSSFPNAKKLINKSIGDGVDAVFVYCREQFEHDQLISMHECGFFSFEATQPAPKIVQIYMANDEETKMGKAFDVDFRNSNIKNTLRENLKSGVERIEHLRIERLVPILSDRCDCLCFHKNGSSFDRGSNAKLRDILNDIRKHKIEFIEKLAIEKMSDICDDLLTKFKSASRSRKKKDSSIYMSIFDYLYEHVAYKNLIEKSQANVDLLIKEFLNELQDIEQSEIYLEYAIPNDNQVENFYKHKIKDHLKILVN